jgi:hypothetical protein
MFAFGVIGMFASIAFANYFSQFMPLSFVAAIEILIIGVFLYWGFKKIPSQKYFFIGGLIMFIAALLIPGLCIYIPIR